MTGIVAAGTAALIPSGLASGAANLLARREVVRGAAVPELPRRFYAAAVALEGGYSLVTGGYAQPPSDDRAVPTSSVFLLDPEGRVSRVRPMSTARARHGILALPDGTVAVMGGFTPRLTEGVEIYNPYADVWTRGEPLPSPASDFSAVLTPQGALLVGAINANGTPVARLITRLAPVITQP